MNSKNFSVERKILQWALGCLCFPLSSFSYVQPVAELHKKFKNTVHSMAAGIRDLYHGSGSVKSIQRLEFSKNCSFQYYFTKPLRTGLYFLTLKKLKTTKIGTPRQCLGAFLTYLEPLKKHNSPKFVTFTTRA